MKYVHRFQVPAPLAQVAAFHRDPSSMGAITPPPVVVRVHEAPCQLADATEMAFTLWMGPLPIRWRARIDQVSPTGFRDSQLSGPYASWVHRHTFTALGAHCTEILDEVDASLPADVGRRLLALALWINMPLLFAYRAWKTRRILRQDLGRSPSSTGAR